MWRRLLKVIIPVAVLALVMMVVSGLALLGAEQNYRNHSNQEIAALLGVASTSDDTAELISNLRHPRPMQVAAGEELLYQYGYLPSDYASPSAGKFFWQALMVILIALVVFAMMVMLYFGWRDRRRSQQITQLIIRNISANAFMICIWTKIARMNSLSCPTNCINLWFYYAKRRTIVRKRANN